MSNSTTSLWVAPTTDPVSSSSSTVDLGGTHRKPVRDKNQSSRAALTAVMGELAQLYADLEPDASGAVLAQIMAIHDKIGRVKIGLLPKAS